MRNPWKRGRAFSYRCRMTENAYAEYRDIIDVAIQKAIAESKSEEVLAQTANEFDEELNKAKK